MDGRIGGWGEDGRVDEWMDGWMDGYRGREKKGCGNVYLIDGKCFNIMAVCVHYIRYLVDVNKYNAKKKQYMDRWVGQAYGKVCGSPIRESCQQYMNDPKLIRRERKERNVLYGMRKRG